MDGESASVDRDLVSSLSRVVPKAKPRKPDGGSPGRRIVIAAPMVELRRPRPPGVRWDAFEVPVITSMKSVCCLLLVGVFVFGQRPPESREPMAREEEMISKNNAGASGMSNCGVDRHDTRGLYLTAKSC